MTRYLGGFILGLSLGVGCGGAPAPDPLGAVTVPSLPEWTDRYAASKKGDVRFFNISSLMSGHGLTRLQAVELQNHYRDLTRTDPDQAGPEAFQEALARVRRGELESGLDAAALAKAPFIVVFDLDDTLYDQYGASEGCRDFGFERPGKGPKHVRLVPGWDEAFRRIRTAGGLVALFSANLDESTHANLRRWTYEGQDLMTSPHIAGVLTNSHLVLQEKTEGRGASNPRQGQPVAEPSKDLRVFDESLERVMVVDDNPHRLFQLGNVRLFKKFHAKALCEGVQEVREAYALALKRVVDEVVEAADHARGQSVTFAAAFLPYSILGQVTVRWLMEAHDWDEPTAIAFVRAHPEVVEDRF